TSQFISDLTYIASHYESSPAYMKVNGRPVVFLFGVDAEYIDYNRATLSIPGNPLLILRGTNGLTHPLVDGGFSWVNIQSNTPFNPELNVQDSFFKPAKQVHQRLAEGAVFEGVKDTLSHRRTDDVMVTQL